MSFLAWDAGTSEGRERVTVHESAVVRFIYSTGAALAVD